MPRSQWQLGKIERVVRSPDGVPKGVEHERCHHQPSVIVIVSCRIWTCSTIDILAVCYRTESKRWGSWEKIEEEFLTNNFGFLQITLVSYKKQLFRMLTEKFLEGWFRTFGVRSSRTFYRKPLHWCVMNIGELFTSLSVQKQISRRTEFSVSSFGGPYPLTRTDSSHGVWHL